MTMSKNDVKDKLVSKSEVKDTAVIRYDVIYVKDF
jgi:hypothetical protein